MLDFLIRHSALDPDRFIMIVSCQHRDCRHLHVHRGGDLPPICLRCKRATIWTTAPMATGRVKPWVLTDWDRKFLHYDLRVTQD